MPRGAKGGAESPAWPWVGVVGHCRAGQEWDLLPDQSFPAGPSNNLNTTVWKEKFADFVSSRDSVFPFFQNELGVPGNREPEVLDDQRRRR